MNSVTYRRLSSLPTSELVSKGYVLDYLLENGADDEAVSDLCELYCESFHGDWVWRYPITGEAGVQAVIFPVREGFRWIPCDYKQGGRYQTENAELLDTAALGILKSELAAYAGELCAYLEDAIHLCPC